jgi:M-phase inducer tyrosine phosphatase
MAGFRRSASTLLSPTHCKIPVPQLGSPKSPSRASYYQDRSPKDECFLPTLPRSGSIPKITCDTLVGLLTGAFDSHFAELYILDARYRYEFEGGHIKGAINVDSASVLSDGFFAHPTPNAVIVFHCEFSHNRGPQLAGVFRELDRDMNKHCYPSLFYPNAYILGGGYRQFHADHPEFCDGGYTRMLDDEHRMNGNLMRETTRWKRMFEELEGRHRKALVAINKPANHELLKSPVALGAAANSPISSRMMSFVASPLQPRRI